MGWAFGPAHFLGAQRVFENDGTPYFVSLARGTKLFFNILRKYGTPLPCYSIRLKIDTQVKQSICADPPSSIEKRLARGGSGRRGLGYVTPQMGVQG